MKHTLTLFMLVCGVSFASAQCPTTVVASATVTHETCPSNGTALISSNIPAGEADVYTIIAGPAYVGSPQDTNYFSSLPSGDYSVVVSCLENGESDTVDFTIDDNYSDLGTADITTGSLCGEFTAKGFIKINSVVGGSTPLQYSVLQSADPSYPDSLSTYSSVDSFVINSFGTYQVRIKDACGQYITNTVNIAPSLPPAIIGWIDIRNTDGCPTDSMSINDFDLRSAISGAIIDNDPYFDAGGFIITIWEQGTSGCGPSGSPVFNDTLTSTNFKVPLVPSKKYYIQFITPCGDTNAVCRDATVSTTKSVNTNFTIGGCVDSATFPESEDIAVNFNFLRHPITVITKKTSDNSTVDSSVVTSGNSYLVEDLPLDEYEIIAVDACGDTVTNIADNPTDGGSPELSYEWSDFWRCFDGEGLTQTGSGQFRFSLSGYVPDMSNAELTIMSGPSNVGNVAYTVDEPNIFYWNNMMPGNYTIRVNTACYDSTFSLTIPSTVNTLTQDISITAESYCGGGGYINTDYEYTGSYATSFVLVDNITGLSIDSNLTGEFSVDSGQYLVKLKVNNYCSGTPYYIPSNTVDIIGSTGAPQITQKYGIVCDAGGPSTTGNVYLTLAGASPLILQYKESTDTTWISVDSNASTFEVIEGLSSGVNYDIRAISCGNTSITMTTLNPLGTVTFTNTLYPCVDAPYTLSVPSLPGATYVWTKEGDTIATTRQVSIANYDLSYDGIYVATVMIDSCVIRTAYQSIYGNLCGDTIEYNTISGYVFNDSNALLDNQLNGSMISNAEGTPLYISILDESGNIITTVPVSDSGKYEIYNIPEGNYTLVITTNPLGSTTPQLPADWVNTSENLGTAPGSDGNSDGMLDVIVTNVNVEHADFGVQKTPNSEDQTNHFSAEPTVGTLFNLGTEPLSGTDLEDQPTSSPWTNTVIINTTPTEGFVLIYQGDTIQAGDTILNFNPDSLFITSTDATPAGTDSTAFTYTVVDNAGYADTTPATYVVTFGVPLPVEIISFTAKANENCEIMLNWNVAEESKIDHYILENSNDATNFKSIARQKALGSNSKYSFLHTSAPKGNNYYRLKIVSIDADNKFSEVVTVFAICDGKQTISVYPTFNDGVIYVSGAPKNAIIDIYDMNGKKVIADHLIHSEVEQVSIKNVPAANYVVVIKVGSEQYTFKVVKQ